MCLINADLLGNNITDEGKRKGIKPQERKYMKRYRGQTMTNNINGECKINC